MKPDMIASTRVGLLPWRQCHTFASKCVFRVGLRVQPRLNEFTYVIKENPKTQTNTPKINGTPNHPIIFTGYVIVCFELSLKSSTYSRPI